MPQSPATPEEAGFNEWLLHPVTKQLREAVRARQEGLKERWAAGAFTDMHRFGNAMLNAKAVGQYQELDWLNELEFTDLYPEMEIVNVNESAV